MSATSFSLLLPNTVSEKHWKDDRAQTIAVSYVCAKDTYMPLQLFRFLKRGERESKQNQQIF